MSSVKEIVEEIVEESGLTRTEFSRKYGIPYRTLQNWCCGVRTPPEWVIKLLIIAEKRDGK